MYQVELKERTRAGGWPFDDSIDRFEDPSHFLISMPSSSFDRRLSLQPSHSQQPVPSVSPEPWTVGLVV